MKLKCENTMVWLGEKRGLLKRISLKCRRILRNQLFMSFSNILVWIGENNAKKQCKKTLIAVENPQVGFCLDESREI